MPPNMLAITGGDLVLEAVMWILSTPAALIAH